MVFHLGDPASFSCLDTRNEVEEAYLECEREIRDLLAAIVSNWNTGRYQTYSFSPPRSMIRPMEPEGLPWPASGDLCQPVICGETLALNG
jgi:hypothetical protein